MMQYKECYESWRMHERFIWQMEALAITVSGGLVAFSFAQDMQPRVVECIIIIIAFLLTLSLLFAVIKHRYFCEVEQRTLCRLEQELGMRKIQRITLPQPKNANMPEGDEYWYQVTFRESLNKIVHWRSAHTWLMSAMFLILIVLLVLLILLIFTPWLLN